jgi:hypothetical protein
MSDLSTDLAFRITEMKMCISKSFVVPVLVAAFGCVLAGHATAQTVKCMPLGQ